MKRKKRKVERMVEAATFVNSRGCIIIDILIQMATRTRRTGVRNKKITYMLSYPNVYSERR